MKLHIRFPLIFIMILTASLISHSNPFLFTSSNDEVIQSKLQSSDNLIKENLIKNELNKEKIKPNGIAQAKVNQDIVPLDPYIKKPVKVKGIYISNWMAASKKFDELVRSIDATELNAMVIDVKDDNGLLTYRSQNKEVEQWHANYEPLITDLQQWLDILKEKNIYTIARIVTFKDSHLAKQRSDWALRKHDGQLWSDRKNNYWVNPYNKEVWDYNIAVAKEAARLGFDEIQFDYVRFPENEQKVNREVDFGNTNQWTKAESIAYFLEEAKWQLNSYPVFISADVFGLTTSSEDDMGIGQQWEKIADNVDYICPMVYPSHYSEGSYGIDKPDLYPYQVVSNAMADALKRNQQLIQNGKNPAQIRPWFQSFTASWIEAYQEYDLKQIKEQIKAAEELGIHEYLLWNAASNYDVLFNQSNKTKG